ncbi:hypothetical protein M5D96_011462 [Drosophila gunungcola]|uniref:Apple domain-containing protein n=1 Tax=Drosophila gunungcola TaxID=103775 RepID=A0A9P9YEW3_9MUSC|nr:hypothetical protein M5D96_011462 [Drosophila gunungcola]
MIAISDNMLGQRLMRLQFAFLLIGLWDFVEALTVDNQLVSARNDCFERIALEAMLPFEKTFRTEDTNSLKMCKEKCLQAGEKCQAISFGVHRRGNGTCQLSSEQYGSGGGGRPGGVIFDPDFDLYTRKTNCFDLSDNSIAPGPLPIPGPSPISPGPTPLDLPNRPLDNNYPSPNEEAYIPGGYAANAPEVDERYRPHYGPIEPAEDEGIRPTPHSPPRPIFGLGYGNGYSYGSPERYTPPKGRPSNRPEYPPRPHDSSTPPSYGPRPSPSYDPHREPRPDYTNRPDPPAMSPHDGYGMNGPSARPSPPPYEGPPPPPRDEFMCEGFNYRLDPSGHGQGDCELVEMPLAQMDLYSSPDRRDANLLRHPDYDYYERDRNAPSSCRRSACQDCSKGPPVYFKPSAGGGYGDRDRDRDRDHYRPPVSTAVDHYRGPSGPPGSSYEHRPPPFSSEFHGSHSSSSHSSSSQSSFEPDRWETLPSSSGYDSSAYRPPRPETDRIDKYRPPYRPGSDYSPYRPPSRPSHNYLDRDGAGAPGPPGSYKKPNNYGGSSKHSSSSSSSSYWGLSESQRRKDQQDFNYFQLGAPHRESNSVLSYPGSGYEEDYLRRRNDYRQQWTRRPGQDECSAKTSEGFRLHKTAVKHAYNVPTLTECERLYNQAGRDNCMLCDRPINMLDYYVDIEPDRDYDIYSMADDMDVCRQPPPSRRHDTAGPSTALSDPRNAQCFFRAIDATRFFKSIVRDSLTVRSVGECEMECIRSTKFTCRAFAFRYGQQRHAGLSDWPVRDMDKERHLILDAAFDIFERASYGHGCEIQPIVDEKHKKLCYLGYGSPARLLPPAIKKVISVPSEMACKKECIRFRETTPFKCFAFSYGSHASSFNCELSDLDQTELKQDVHYAHTKDRDFWLFAWNPFDWTCRDKVNTIGGSRVNNDRRMDIFREPGDVAWRHYTVSGKPCRRSSPCAKNLITGFYSCETDASEVGSWDYCCKADHPCGYSKGFDYPWCFVGDESDQWRKCSDRYFPGKNGTQATHSHLGLPSAKEQQKHPHPHPHSHPHPHHSQPATAASSEYSQHPPRPGGLQSLSDFAAARLWPVTYLYSEGPPNATEFSNFVDCNKDSC